jgi:hypothetical protein
MLHLSIGDVWNAINNTERLYGAAVTGVGAVLVSAASVFASRRNSGKGVGRNLHLVDCGYGSHHGHVATQSRSSHELI